MRWDHSFFQMLRYIQRGALQGNLPFCTSRYTIVKIQPPKVKPGLDVFSLQTSSFFSAHVLGKDVFREDYKRRRLEKPLVPSNDPFAMPKALMKSVAYGLALATVVGVIMGCNNSKFRAKLRTTFPYAALWVDLIKGEEDVEEEQKIGSSQSEDDSSPFQTALRAGMLEVKKE